MGVGETKVQRDMWSFEGGECGGDGERCKVGSAWISVWPVVRIPKDPVCLGDGGEVTASTEGRDDRVDEEANGRRAVDGGSDGRSWFVEGHREATVEERDAGSTQG
jgi:hypothetical protein